MRKERLKQRLFFSRWPFSPLIFKVGAIGILIASSISCSLKSDERYYSNVSVRNSSSENITSVEVHVYWADWYGVDQDWIDTEYGDIDVGAVSEPQKVFTSASHNDPLQSHIVPTTKVRVTFTSSSGSKEFYLYSYTLDEYIEATNSKYDDPSKFILKKDKSYVFQVTDTAVALE